MSGGPMDLQTLAHRIEKVERQNRYLKLALLIPILLIMAAGGFVFAFSSPSRIITAEKIRLVDKKGVPRLTLSLENGVSQVTMAYENGDPCLRLSEGELCFYDKGKKARINIIAKDTSDSSSLCVTDKQGKNCVTLTAGAEGSYLSIEDDEEKKEVILGIDPIGTLNGIESTSGRR